MEVQISSYTKDFWKFASNLHGINTIENAFMLWAKKASYLDFNSLKQIWENVTTDVNSYFGIKEAAEITLPDGTKIETGDQPEVSSPISPSVSGVPMPPSPSVSPEGLMNQKQVPNPQGLGQLPGKTLPNLEPPMGSTIPVLQKEKPAEESSVLDLLAEEEAI